MGNHVIGGVEKQNPATAFAGRGSDFVDAD